MKPSMSEALKVLLQDLKKKYPEEIDDEIVQNTPKRFESALNELLSGYHTSPQSHVVLFDCDEEVVYSTCEFYSLCEHHMLPFFGKVHIVYKPHKKVIGLSKVARIVESFSRRLQIQERLTKQIAQFLYNCELKPEGVFVLIEAQHLCMQMRGIKKQKTLTKTIHSEGCFHNPLKRYEALTILRSRGVKIES